MSLIKNKDELLKIKIALEDNFPDSFQLFNIVQLILTEDGIEREVYVNEDFNNKDLAILVFEKIQMPKQDFALFCTKNSLEKLKKIVDEKVDWTKFNQFNGITEERFEMIKRCVPPGFNYYTDGTFFTYHLWPHCQLEDVSKDAEPRKQDESNVCIKPLDSQWISLLTKSWKYHDEGTMKMLKTLVDIGRVFGLFVKDEKEPVAWMLIYGDGFLGMLRTNEKYRNRGFGSLLVETLVEEVKSRGLIPVLCIEDGNDFAMNFYSKRGFKKCLTVYWFFAKPI